MRPVRLVLLPPRRLSVPARWLGCRRRLQETRSTAYLVTATVKVRRHNLTQFRYNIIISLRRFPVSCKSLDRALGYSQRSEKPQNRIYHAFCKKIQHY